MVFIRLTTLLMGFIFTSFVLGDFMGHTQQVLVALENTMISNSQREVAARGLPLDQELVDGVRAGVSKNGKMGGRKMMVNDILKKGVMKEGSNPETLKISGKCENVLGELHGGSQQSLNHQDDKNTAAKAFELPELNNKAPLDLLEKTETKRLLEATNEIESLMRKDYRGMKKPRRKPPINNSAPLSEANDLKPRRKPPVNNNEPVNEDGANVKP